MAPPDDTELLDRYARDGCNVAFTSLVQRHLGAVYNVALRQVGGDTHLAEDVTQIVFSTLARKASSLADHRVLGGWLYRTTHFAARDVVRSERRRRKREQEALTMEKLAPGTGAEVDWEGLRCVLDESMAELKEADRDAVWLRFFEGHSFAEIGGKLRLTENAARMRVDRALDILHAALSRRGVKSTTTALAAALAHQPMVAAPTGLGANVVTAALAGTSAGATAGGLVSLFAMSKIKIGVAGAIVLAVLVPVSVELRANRTLHARLGALGVENIAALRKENQRLTAALAERGKNNAALAEIARLRERATVLKARPDGVLDGELKPAAAHRNAGRATPAAAHETIIWARLARDLDTLSTFIAFADDSKQARDAFMGQFSEAVRTRYRTPERLCAAAVFGTDGQFSAAPVYPDDQIQFLGIDDHVGGDGYRYGQVRLRAWGRSASGKEGEMSFRLRPTPTGYVAGELYLANSPRPSDDASALVRTTIDAATGDNMVPKTRR